MEDSTRDVEDCSLDFRAKFYPITYVMYPYPGFYPTYGPCGSVLHVDVFHA